MPNSGKRKYEPLAVRLKKAQQAKDAKAMREAEKKARDERKAERTAKADVKADKKSGSFAASLDGFISKHGPEADKVGDGEAQVIAGFLQPYVDQLKKLERNLPEFPASDIPWWEIEAVVVGVEDTRAINKIGASFGVDRHRVYEVSKLRKWKERREVLKQLHARRGTIAALAAPTQIISGNGQSLAKSGEDAEEKRFVVLVEDCIKVFTAGLDQGMVRFTSARDLDTLMRLMHFLKGKAEKIEERRHRISPDQFREIVAEVVKQTRFSPAAAGVVIDADYELVGDAVDNLAGTPAEFAALPAPT